MPLKQSDSDQAVRYLQHAREILEREPYARTRTIRQVLDLQIRRLSPGDFHAGDAAAEITVLRRVAEKAPLAGARAEILKAVAVLRDKSR